jgi:hypothetical protein
MLTARFVQRDFIQAFFGPIPGVEIPDDEDWEDPILGVEMPDDENWEDSSSDGSDVELRGESMSMERDNMEVMSDNASSDYMDLDNQTLVPRSVADHIQLNAVGAAHSSTSTAAPLFGTQTELVSNLTF